MDWLLTKIFRITQCTLAIFSIIYGALMPSQIACLPGVSYFGLIIIIICGGVVIFSTYGMKRIIDKLSSENDRYSVLNSSHSEHIKQLQENISKQEKINKSLVAVQAQSQQLLESLMQTGDEFKNFSTILSDTTQKNLTLTERLTILVSGLSKSTFERLDKNHDGVLTLEELNN